MAASAALLSSPNILTWPTLASPQERWAAARGSFETGDQARAIRLNARERADFDQVFNDCLGVHVALLDAAGEIVEAAERASGAELVAGGKDALDGRFAHSFYGR